MKLFKKLAVLCMALTLCVGIGATVVACGGDEPDTSSSATVEGYSFKVLKKDGSPATGYSVYLCQSGAPTICLMPVDVAADGTATIEVDDKTVGYDVHLQLNGKDVSDLDFQASTKSIPANYDGGVITITLNK